LKGLRLSVSFNIVYNISCHLSRGKSVPICDCRGSLSNSELRLPRRSEPLHIGCGPPRTPWNRWGDCMRRTKGCSAVGDKCQNICTPIQHGLLAQGPKSVIAAYTNAIADRVRYSIIPGHRPRGGYRVMLFDDRYVVFREVEVVEHVL